jgi:hypothetical protein
MGFLTDGDGQAGRDLQPGSAYLRELATRPALTGVRVTAIVGRVAVEDLDWTALQARLAGVVGEAKAQELAARAMVGASLAADALGDGVVPVESARWAGASETVVVQAGHRGMVSSRSPDAWLAAMGVGLDTTPAIGVILDRLGVAAPRPGEDPAQ